MSCAYYNEIDPYAAAWLRNLIAAGLIAPGDVDERSIIDVQPDDVRGYVQCHWFAGIGGWSYALRLAGWPDGRPVWTGSCPCQPFSVAGRQKGFADPRHLWPEWHRIISQCRPSTIFGEQVADAPEWLALVRGDLESLGYAVGCMPVEAASAGADHLRDRYWFVADRDSERHEIPFCKCGNTLPECEAAAQGGLCLLALGNFPRCETASPESRNARVSGERSERQAGDDSDCALADSDDAERRPETPGRNHNFRQAPGRSEGDSNAEQRSDRLLADFASDRWGEGWSLDELRCWGPAAAVCSVGGRQIIECPDGKWRRLPPPRVRWLGTRLPARISRVRAFGNAIDPRPAAAFIAAAMECMP